MNATDWAAWIGAGTGALVLQLYQYLTRGAAVRMTATTDNLVIERVATARCWCRGFVPENCPRHRKRAVATATACSRGFVPTIAHGTRGVPWLLLPRAPVGLFRQLPTAPFDKLRAVATVGKTFSWAFSCTLPHGLLYCLPCRG